MTEEPGKESKTTEQLSTHLEAACRHFPQFCVGFTDWPHPKREEAERMGK